MSSPAMVTKNDALRVGVGVTAREFDGEWIILDLNRGSYFGLDHIGGTAWAYIAAGETVDRISDRLAAQYNVEKERVLGDLLRLVSELVDRNLLIPDRREVP